MVLTAERVSRLYDGIRAVETLIAKAIRVDELAQAARIETKLRQYINAQWEVLSKQASKTAAARIRKGKGPVTDAEIDSMLKAVDRTMALWSGKIGDRYTADLREVYELAHVAAVKRGLGRRRRNMNYNTRPWNTGEIKKRKEVGPPVITANFDLVDHAAMDSFEDQQLFWIGQHYEENVSKHVAETAKNHIIEQGRGRVAAGKTMEKVVGDALKDVRVPGGWNGTNKRYFEGLVANAATVQRTVSQVNSFARLGYTKYVIQNPSDHRQCARCISMEGREFKISDAQALTKKLIGAKHPTDVKTIQPFMSLADTKLPNSALVKRGNVLPGFHYRCRCSVDIVEGEEIIQFPI